MYLNSSQALGTTVLWSGSWGDANTYHGWFKTKQNHKSNTKGRSQGWHKYYINLKVEVQDLSVIQKKPIPLGTKWNLLWLCPWDRSNSELNGSQLMKQAHLHKDTCHVPAIARKGASAKRSLLLSYSMGPINFQNSPPENPSLVSLHSECYSMVSSFIFTLQNPLLYIK